MRKETLKKISEEIKSKLDPVPAVRLELKEADGKKLVLLRVYSGQETPFIISATNSVLLSSVSVMSQSLRIVFN